MKKLSKLRVKTTTYMQYEAAECGAASLGIILSYFGLKLELNELRKACGVTRDGSNMKKILEAGRSYGMKGRGCRYSIESLKKNGRFPCIIFWDFNHFLVAEGYSTQYVYLSDPAEGRVKVTHQEFKNKFTGIVLELEPGQNFEPEDRRNSPIEFFKPLLNKYKMNLIQLICLATSQSLLTLFIAGLTTVFIDSFLQNERMYFGIPIIWLLTIAILGLTLLISMQFSIYRRMQFILSKQLTGSLFQELFRADFWFFQSRLQGEVAGRMLLGIQTTQTLISEILRFGLTLWTALIVLIFASIISFWLALLGLSIFLVNVTLNWWISEQRYDENRKLAFDRGKVQGKSLEGINNVETIKSSGLEFDFLSQWQRTFVSVISQKQDLGQQMALSSIVGSGSGILLDGMTLIVGGILIINGQLSLGALLAFQFLKSELIGPIVMLPQLNSRLQLLIGDFGRLEDVQSSRKDPLVKSFEELPNNCSDKLKERESEQTKLSGLIEFKNFSFSFSDNSPPFIQNINLQIQPGTHLAIVGGSGSGKTTIIRLLAGLYEAKEGSLLFDGKSWKEHTDHTMRSSIAYVPQDVFIFNASIKDNITMWDQSFSYEQLLLAAKQSQISEKILSHPDGFERKLNDNGNNLSGGEKQRIELTRALIKQPNILLLDEATSALDNPTQTKILEILHKKNITIVSVAHRLDIALRSDHVLVMDAGMIIESGSPQNLMNKPSKFKELVEKEI